MVLVNLGFHTRKNLIENFPKFGRAPSKIIASPVLGQKSLRGAILLAFLGLPRFSGRLWLTLYIALYGY